MYKVLEGSFSPGGVDDNGNLHSPDNSYVIVAKRIKTREQAEAIMKIYEESNKNRYVWYDVLAPSGVNEDDLPF